MPLPSGVSSGGFSSLVICVLRASLFVKLKPVEYIRFRAQEHF